VKDEEPEEVKTLETLDEKRLEAGEKL